MALLVPLQATLDGAPAFEEQFEAWFQGSKTRYVGSLSGGVMLNLRTMSAELEAVAEATERLSNGAAVA